MQGNGFKIALAAFFLVLSGYYLYPSVRHYFNNQKLEAMSADERVEYERTNFESLRGTREKALKLGLDLLGGMHVTLEVRVDALIRQLAADTDAQFDEVLSAARDAAVSGEVSMIDAFVSEFERRDPDARLSRYFRNEAAGISRRSSNQEIAAWLSTEADEAVTRAIEIIRDRVDRFGVTEPSIQKQGTRRIVVELPGIDDPDRVRGLLRGTARLEFRLMADPNELTRSLQQIIQYFETGAVAAVDSAATGDSTATAADSTAAVAAAAADSTTDVADLLAQSDTTTSSGNQLLDVFQPVGQGVVLGRVNERDTSAVNAMLSDARVAALLPTNIVLMYGSAPVGTAEDGFEVYDLMAVRSEIELTGETITDARVEFNQQTNVPEVSMTMNSEGSRTWARLTGANVGRNVAIVLDNVVYSYPTVINRITGGRSSITGLADRNEATDIVTVLKSGALPAPVEIAEERTVGPSIGQAAINSGMYSVLFGFLFVAIFMIVWYKTAGSLAVGALVLNLVLILGIMAAFGATLTLPGIAGIVLTIGMAVDANVLIYERIREEQRSGKTMKASMEAGYSRALSAILDGNITTFFVGVILYSFGVGPIQGFAVTLMAGILSSMFTAIVCTRIVFDYLVVERRALVSVG